jgi:hypothetical protein
MKNRRQPLILAVSLAAMLALSACGKNHDSASAVPDTQPPAVQPMTPALPVPAASSASVAKVSFDSVELGTTVDAGNKIVAAGTSFAPKDTIYASVETSGTGTSIVAASWSYQDGQIVSEDSKTIHATGAATTAFMISKPSGLPAGNYKVQISLDGSPVASKAFVVR